MESCFYMLEQGACRLWVYGVEKIVTNPIFSVPDVILNFAITYMAVKMSAALVFFLTEQQRMALHIVMNYNCKPAVQFWGQTLIKTFFSDKYLCVNICIS